MKAFFKLVVAFVFFTNIVPQRVNAQCTLSPLPYYEGFQSITNNNQLPLCWASNSLGTTCLTYTNGTKYAAFYHSPAAVSYFYSKQIQLMPGYTYSVSIWYNTGNSGGLNWTDLSLLKGLSQNLAGLIPIVSTNGPASSPLYTALSGTFTVSSFGMNYIAVRATGSPTGAAQYLYWDDLQVSIPCSLNPVNMNMISTGTTLCVGQQSVLITAYGASQYLWNNGSTSSAIVVSPVVSTLYSVIGTNAITNCTTTASQMITVNPSPIVSVFVSGSNTICLGESITITAAGASSYLWANGSTGATIVLTPTVTQFFNVTGSNSFSCTNVASQNIVVAPCLGLADHALFEASIKVYPNPFEDLMFINTGTNEEKLMVVFDVSGRKLISFGSEDETVKCPTESLKPGIYYLKISSKGKFFYQKVVKG